VNRIQTEGGPRPTLARISHRLSAAASEAPHPAVFSRLGVLDVLSSTTPRPSGRKLPWARRLAALATKAGEKCGLRRTHNSGGWVGWASAHLQSCSRLVILGLIVLVSIAGCRQEAPESGLSAADERWVSTTLAGMSLEEKAAQMIMIAETGYPRNPRSETALELVEAIRDHGVGGLVLMRSEEATIPRLLNGEPSICPLRWPWAPPVPRMPPASLVR